MAPDPPRFWGVGSRVRVLGFRVSGLGAEANRQSTGGAEIAHALCGPRLAE